MGASLPLHGDCVGVMNGNEGGTVGGAHQQGRAGTLWLDGSGRQALKKRYPIEIPSLIPASPPRIHRESIGERHPGALLPEPRRHHKEPCQ